MTDPTQNAFRALADPTRRRIIQMLVHKEMTIAEVSDHFDMTRAAVKKHLTVLSDGGLIYVETHGRARINRVNPNGLTPILSWLEVFDHFWDTRLTALKTAIEKDIQ